jgi:hypothetical protein
MSCLKETKSTTTRAFFTKWDRLHVSNIIIISYHESNDRLLDHLNLKPSQLWPIVTYALSQSPFTSIKLSFL